MLTFEVTAEVVPVRLDLDVTDLELAFDAHSLEPSVDQEVTLTNPGNSAVTSNVSTCASLISYWTTPR